MSFMRKRNRRCGRSAPDLAADQTRFRHKPVLNLHAILPRSRANGPGVRMTIWFQGCSLRCPGCFNPETHSHAPRILMSVDELAAQILAAAQQIEGITISGGEPLQQARELNLLLEAVRPSGLSVILFSGYTLPEIVARPRGREILAAVDVLVAGRYVQAKRVGRNFLGSANQTIHLLTRRYALHDLAVVPHGEVLIDANGQVHCSGFWPLEAKSLQR